MSKMSQGAVFNKICEYAPYKSTAHFAVLQALLYYGKWEDCTNIRPGLKKIAGKTTLSIRQVRRILTDLEADGFIVTENKKGGRGKQTLYAFNFATFGIAVDVKPTQNGYIPRRNTIDEEFKAWEAVERAKQYERNT